MTSSCARWAIRSVVNFTSELETANNWEPTLSTLARDWDVLNVG